MHRQMGQPSLVDSLLPGTLGRNERSVSGGRSSGTDSMRGGWRVFGAGGTPQLSTVDDGEDPAAPAVATLSDTLMEEALDDRIVPPFRGTGA